MLMLLGVMLTSTADFLGFMGLLLVKGLDRNTANPWLAVVNLVWVLAAMVAGCSRQISTYKLPLNSSEEKSPFISHHDIVVTIVLKTFLT